MFLNSRRPRQTSTNGDLRLIKFNDKNFRIEFRDRGEWYFHSSYCDRQIAEYRFTELSLRWITQAQQPGEEHG